MGKSRRASRHDAPRQQVQLTATEHDAPALTERPKTSKPTASHRASNIFSISHALIIKPELGKAVTRILRKYYKTVEVRLFCSDDSCLTYNNDEWVCYQNYNNRRIIEIIITAKSTIAKRNFTQVDILGEAPKSPLDTFLDRTVNLKIFGLSNDDMRFLRAELIDVFKEMKPGYSFLTKNLMALIIKTFPVAYTIYYLLVLLIKGRLPIVLPQSPPPLDVVLIAFTLLAGLSVVITVMSRVKDWFFPLTFFAIGQGEQRFQSKEKWRDTFFIGFVCSCILGGYVTNITSPYFAKWLHLVPSEAKDSKN